MYGVFLQLVFFFIVWIGILIGYWGLNSGWNAWVAFLFPISLSVWIAVIVCKFLSKFGD